VRKFTHMWAGFQRDSQAGESHLHPMEKPVALMQWSIGWFPKAKVIVDPYMGSGTTGIACSRAGRKFIGIEIDPTHFDTAVARVTEELSRTALLEPVATITQRSMFIDEDA
jgi:site-specific DNA-methyltransferase (adenine-specific)